VKNDTEFAPLPPEVGQPGVRPPASNFKAWNTITRSFQYRQPQIVDVAITTSQNWLIGHINVILLETMTKPAVYFDCQQSQDSEWHSKQPELHLLWLKQFGDPQDNRHVS
jgi:hypothetical protein